MAGKILVVDDDAALIKTIERILIDAGYAPILAHTAEDGLRLAVEERPDLALLDIMVPSMGGWEVCRRLRELSEIPIIFLTALGDVNSVVRGLEMGADDYVVKPFKRPEILARIKAQLRRAQAPEPPTRAFDFGRGALHVDIEAHVVRIEGDEVELTPREFELLATLVQNAGRVVPTADLVRKAWGLNDDSAKENIKPYIHYLRKKIEVDPTLPRWIKTVRGVGYRFADE
jgi:two-component system KDP operon response regulator KdpE